MLSLFKSKYLLRLKGDSEPCMMVGCERPVTGALVDDETDRARAVCDYHIVPIIADQEGLRVVRFVDNQEDTTNG